jgi:cytochrome c556
MQRNSGGRHEKKGNGLMKRTILVAGALMLGIGAVAAQQDVVNQVQVLMKGNGRNAGALAAIVKGEKPYDQATVDAAFVQFDDTAKKLPSLFPDSTKGLKPEGTFSASPKIWENKAEFAAHIASFAKAVADGKATVKDLDTLKASMAGIGKECGSCHETFRLKS